MPLIGKPFGLTSGVAAAATYTIDNSCVFGASDYLSFTPGATATLNTKLSLSMWVKVSDVDRSGTKNIFKATSGGNAESYFSNKRHFL